MSKPPVVFLERWGFTNLPEFLNVFNTMNDGKPWKSSIFQKAKPS